MLTDVQFLILERYYNDRVPFGPVQFEQEFKTHPDFIQFNIAEMQPAIEFLRNKQFISIHSDHALNTRTFKIEELGKVAYNQEKSRRLAQLQKEEFEDKKDKLDYLQKEFIYKKRYWPFIISGFALLVSIGGLIISIIALSYKTDPPKISPETEKTQAEKRQKTGPLEKPPLKIDSSKKSL